MNNSYNKHHNKNKNNHKNNNNNHHNKMVKDFRNRFWICLVVTIPILLLSSIIQRFFGYRLTFSGDKQFLLASATFIYGYGIWPFLKGAIQELKKTKPGMMSLVTIAVSIAFFYSFFVTLNLITGKVFFWEVATLIDVMLLGHWIEMRSVLDASRALEKLAHLLPSTVHLIKENGNIKDIKLEQLKRKDKILIKPGEQIPADGIVLDGASEVNESALTGESKPVSKKIDAHVIGGSLNINGSLTIRIEKTGKDSYLAKVVELVRQASASKSQAQSIADKVALWLTIIAIVAGSLTFVIWLSFNMSLSFSLERMVTVMVITCPHALGLAIPLVISVVTTIAAKNGFLIRNRTAFEKSRQITAVVFDKTGTLTTGMFGVTNIIPTADWDEAKIINNAAAIEIHSEHSIAQSIVTKAKKKNIKKTNYKIKKATKFKAISGKGAQGIVEEENIFIGSFNMLGKISFASAIRDEKNVKKIKNIINNYTAEGKTVVVIATKKEIKGIIALSDIIRNESKEACRLLKNQKIYIAMITGDNLQTATYVAKELGIDKVFAHLLPDQKSSKVKLLQKQGYYVAMVGDGINDAPALAQADVGIAIGAGTDIAAETADIILVKNDPRNVVDIFSLSSLAYRKMTQNLAWATGYNVIAIPLAAGLLYTYKIVLTPAIGAAIMSLSTIIVSINARLISFKKRL